MEHQKLQINVRNVNLEAYWDFDVENQECLLCHKNLSDTTLKELEDATIDNKIIICKCNHGFHDSCLESWKKTGNTFCPKDNSDLITIGVANNTMVVKNN